MGWATSSRENYAAFAEGARDFAEAARLMKLNVEQHPDQTASMFGLVRTLSKLGRYAEAQAYLARLRRTNEMWAHGASLLFSALRGDYARDPAALEQAFAHPLTTNASRGNVCFMLGNIECGIRWWHQMESGYLPTYWEYGPGNEAYWAPGVLEDPRHREIVNELGWGSRWRAHIRAIAAELTPIIGIEVTSPPPPEDLAAGA